MKSKIFTVSIILLLLSGKAIACGHYFRGPSIHYIFHLGYPMSYAHNDYYTDWKVKTTKIY